MVGLGPRRQAQGARLLARHAAAARPRRRAARRPARARAGRAGERSRPGRHPLAARLLPAPRRRGTQRARLQPPAQRGAGDRRPGGDPQPRAAGPRRLDPRAARRHRHRAWSADRISARSTRRCARRGCSRCRPARRRCRCRASTLDQVGHLAFTAGVELHELSKQGFDLEDLFFQLTDRRAHRRADLGPAPSNDPPDPRRVPQAAHHPGLVLAAAGRASASDRAAVVLGSSPPSRRRARLRQRRADDRSPSAGPAYVVVFVLGVLGVTTEFRYQTITPTVLVTPSRWTLITAKMITYALVGASVRAHLRRSSSWRSPLPWLSSKNIDSRPERPAPARARCSACSSCVALFGIIGLGVGALLRNQIVAVTVGVIFLLDPAEHAARDPGRASTSARTCPAGAVRRRCSRRPAARRQRRAHLLSPRRRRSSCCCCGRSFPAILGAGLTMNRDIT